MWNKFELFRKNILLIIAIAMAFLLINFSLNLKPSGAQQDVKWKYKGISYKYINDSQYICLTNDTIENIEHFDPSFNKYGQDGWELVGFHEIGSDRDDVPNCQEAVFKKQSFN